MHYEVIEELPGGGAFLMASSNPFDFGKPEIEDRIDRLREVLRPITMSQAANERDARTIADRLRCELAKGDGP